jgi:LEA14-like dessication related protein
MKNGFYLLRRRARKGLPAVGKPRSRFGIVVPVLCALLAACNVLAPKFEKPDLSVVGIQMVNGNLLQQNFRVTLKIHNPNAREIPVIGVHAELRASGEELASGESNRAFVVPAFGDSEFDMTISANLAMGLLKLADKLDKHLDSIDYDLTGVASIDLPLLRSLPFHHTGTLSLRH